MASHEMASVSATRPSLRLAMDVTTSSSSSQSRLPPPHQVHDWSRWRSTMPITPPASAVDHHAAPHNLYEYKPITVLPPITTLDQHIRAPPTPPYESTYSYSRQLPPLRSTFSQETGLSSDLSAYVSSHPPVIAPVAAAAQHNIDWFGTSQTPSSRFLAEKTCEMICYMWFGTSATILPSPPNDTPGVSTQQLVPSHVFVAFLQKVLETTQVSESVIVLALHYIWRLKQARFKHVNGLPGSEWRVAIAGLMLANKFVDDNTYTNKTWSEVAGVPLLDVNAMEREFLEGIGHNLYVNSESYDSWLKLLKGLVATKERAREVLYHQRTRRAARPVVASRPPPYHSYVSYAQHPTHSPRARSSSPQRPTTTGRPSVPALYIPASSTAGDPSPTRLAPMAIDVAAANAGGKRSASDAFSPTSIGFDHERPQKRPTSMILEIPQYRLGQISPPTSKASSPLEPLNGFSRLSLAAADSPVHMHASSGSAPRALVAPYRMDPSRHPIAPQNLYYYALSGSPAETPSEEVDPDHMNRYSWRKGRLQYHQPTISTTTAYPPPASYPTSFTSQVHSTCTSPRDASRVLPPLQRPEEVVAFANHAGSYAPTPAQAQPPVYAPVPVAAFMRHDVRPEVPAAPFANAGPPGFHFSAAAATTPAYGTTPDWAWQHRGRQL